MLRGLYRASVDDFHLHPQSYKVTKVLMLLKIFNKNQRLQGCRGYAGCDAFEKFQQKTKGCKVAEVAGVVHGFC